MSLELGFCEPVQRDLAIAYEQMRARSLDPVHWPNTRGPALLAGRGYLACRFEPGIMPR